MLKFLHETYFVKWSPHLPGASDLFYRKLFVLWQLEVSVQVEQHEPEWLTGKDSPW